jgi:hypothetical protein
MANLTQLSAVKTRLGISDTADDTLLTNFIKFASARFERQTNRLLDRQAAATDEFSADTTELRVSRYPIESVSAFHLKTDETEGWVAQTGIDYIIRCTCVVSLPFPIGDSSQLVRLTYAGGYVLPGTTPGSGQTALPDDLEQACVEQVTFWYQRRHQLGLVTVPADGRTFYEIRQLDLLPNVLPVLKKYERILS